MARYKVTKEQLERVVESFVMESSKKQTNNISKSDMKMVNLISEKYNMKKEEVIKEMEVIKEFDEKTWMKNFHAFIQKGLPKLGVELTKDQYNKIVDAAKADNFNGDYKVVDGELTYVPSTEVTGKAAKLPWWKRLGGRDHTTGK